MKGRFLSIALLFCAACFTVAANGAFQAYLPIIHGSNGTPAGTIPTPTATLLSPPTATPTPSPTVRLTNTLTPSPIRTLTPTATFTPTPCVPKISFTVLPPYGSSTNLEGKAACVAVDEYQVAVYIFVGGWWTKPSFADPITLLQTDGSWTTDITTGGSDVCATEIAAFLIPNGYTPPALGGTQKLPPELFDNAVAHKLRARTSMQRAITFSGYTWYVKACPAQLGPGPNYFSDRTEDVWVDSAGRLHLHITQRENRWYATEIVNALSLGYGTYTFTLASRVDLLDPNAVVGLFTWEDGVPEANYREIDIEFSRWGQPAAENAQFVIQPFQHPGNLERFLLNLVADHSTHRFIWQPDQIDFLSYQGSSAAPGAVVKSWIYTGADIPIPDQENVRLNFWLFNGVPPTDSQEMELIVESFTFTPLPQPAVSRQ